MKIFRFVKKVFFVGLAILSDFTNANPMSCISMKNQECKTRPQVVNCSENCNNINNPYTKNCVPDAIKNLNVKVFNLMSRTNETRFIEWHETCKCKRRLDAIVCNNKQRWNKDKSRCEYKELIDKGVCGKGYIGNPSNWECKYDETCDIGGYLDHEN